MAETIILRALGSCSRDRRCSAGRRGRAGPIVGAASGRTGPGTTTGRSSPAPQRRCSRCSTNQVHRGATGPRRRPGHDSKAEAALRGRLLGHRLKHRKGSMAAKYGSTWGSGNGTISGFRGALHYEQKQPGDNRARPGSDRPRRITLGRRRTPVGATASAAWLPVSLPG